jgi:hypothetical protein
MIERSSALLGCLWLFACSSVDTVSLNAEPPAESEAADVDEAVVEVPSEVLNSVQVGEERVDFIAFGAEGDPRDLLIRSVHPTRMGRFAVDRLESAAGEALTPLEVFYALAPAGEEPSALLVETHAQLAAARGRPDASVRRVSLESSDLVEKAWTPASCEAAVLPFNPFSPWITPYTGSDGTDIVDQCTHPNGCGAWAGALRHRAGVCNNGPSTLSGRAYTRYVDSSGWTAGLPYFNVMPDQSLLWTWVITRFKDDNPFETVASRMRYTATTARGSQFIARGSYVHY